MVAALRIEAGLLPPPLAPAVAPIAYTKVVPHNVPPFASSISVYGNTLGLPPVAAYSAPLLHKTVLPAAPLAAFPYGAPALFSHRLAAGPVLPPPLLPAPLAAAAPVVPAPFAPAPLVPSAFAAPLPAGHFAPAPFPLPHALPLAANALPALGPALPPALGPAPLPAAPFPAITANAFPSAPFFG